MRCRTARWRSLASADASCRWRLSLGVDPGESSHGLQTTDHADAATDALEEARGTVVLAYGNIQQGSWEWSTTPEFRDFYVRRFDGKGDMAGFAIAFDIPGDGQKQLNLFILK